MPEDIQKPEEVPLPAPEEQKLSVDQIKFHNKRANWLTVLAILAVFALIIATVWRSNSPEYVKGIITFALGRFFGYLDQIFNFEFGTTRASKQKDDTISKLSKGT